MDAKHPEIFFFEATDNFGHMIANLHANKLNFIVG